jgi:prepilin-type N-terminal cleavage/methylation domain-containing protein/prepilin-type processing-associated H-X9-DG protein
MKDENSPNVKTRKGFTLVELLVVIGIIAVLISILLPAFSKAQRSAITVECMSNMREIGGAMQMYATQNYGWLPGSPITTAAFVTDPNGWTDEGPHAPKTYKLSDSTTTQALPGILGFYDWQSPLATVMGLDFDQKGAAQDIFNRFAFINTYGVFQCPANTNNGSILQFYSASPIYYPLPKGSKIVLPNPWTNFMPSMVESMFFMQSEAICKANGVYVGYGDADLPSGYVPKLNKIGDPDLKIYVADGCRWSSPEAGEYPDVYLGPALSGADTNQTVNGADPGPWDVYTHAYNRTDEPDGLDGPSQGPIDCRALSCRHGAVGFNQQSDTYKFNALFFDGHVETLGDLQGANPVFWLPKGSVIPAMAGSVYPDVLLKYYGITSKNNPSPIYINE